MDATLVTPSGLRNLTSELELLRRKREALRTAAEGASVGGFSAELHNVDELARLERQISMLENRLASATVVHPNPADGELDVGGFARIRDLDTGELTEYRIGGAGEAKPATATGSISYASPVGSALLGRRVGDVIEIEVPGGLLRLEVLKIES